MSNDVAVIVLILASLMLWSEVRLQKIERLLGVRHYTVTSPNIVLTPNVPIRAYVYPDHRVVLLFRNGEVTTAMLAHPPLKGDYIMWGKHRIKVQRKEYSS